MRKSLIGWINEDDFDLYEKMFKKDGVTHATLFRHNPHTSEDKEIIKQLGICYKKVCITITEIRRRKK